MLTTKPANEIRVRNKSKLNSKEKTINMGIPSLGWKCATIPKLVEAPPLVGEIWLNGNGEGVWVA